MPGCFGSQSPGPQVKSSRRVRVYWLFGTTSVSVNIPGRAFAGGAGVGVVDDVAAHDRDASDVLHEEGIGPSARDGDDAAGVVSGRGGSRLHLHAGEGGAVRRIADEGDVRGDGGRRER